MPIVKKAIPGARLPRYKKRPKKKIKQRNTSAKGSIKALAETRKLINAEKIIRRKLANGTIERETAKEKLKELATQTILNQHRWDVKNYGRNDAINVNNTAISKLFESKLKELGLN